MSTYARAEERRRNYIKSLLLVAAKRRARITAPVQLTRLAGYVLHPDAPRMPYITDPTGRARRHREQWQDDHIRLVWPKTALALMRTIGSLCLMISLSHLPLTM